MLAQPLEVMLARNDARPDPRPSAAIRRQHRRLAASLASLQDEGYERVCLLDSEAALDGVEVILEGQGSRGGGHANVPKELRPGPVVRDHRPGTGTLDAIS